jgi:uncharacterized protein (TIGR02217 family)
MALVFPYLPGLTWPVARSGGLWDTTKQVALSGKEVRFANRTQARYQYTLSLEALDSDGSRSALVANSKQTLEGFFNQLLGGALSFWFWDVDDCQVISQNFGVGDGSTAVFQLVRTAGGWTDNVFAPLNSGSPVTVPSAAGGTTTATYAAPNIYIGGVLQSPSAYSISTANGQITFASPPAAAAALTWDGNYYWLCNFDDDTIAMEKFMRGLWSAKKISFTTRIP